MIKIAGLSASVTPGTPIKLRGIRIVVLSVQSITVTKKHACYKNKQKINTSIGENSILRNAQES